MTQIYLNPNILHELKSNYFDNHAHKFQDIFKQFIHVCVNNIGCSVLFTDWVNNLDEAEYHKNVNKGETIPSLKIKLIVMLIDVIGHQKLLMKFSAFNFNIN